MLVELKEKLELMGGGGRTGAWEETVGQPCVPTGGAGAELCTAGRNDGT